MCERVLIVVCLYAVMCCIYLIILKTPPATLITPPNTSNAGFSSSLIYSGGRRDTARPSLEERRVMQTESGMRANEMQQSGIYDAG